MCTSTLRCGWLCECVLWDSVSGRVGDGHSPLCASVRDGFCRDGAVCVRRACGREIGAQYRGYVCVSVLVQGMCSCPRVRAGVCEAFCMGVCVCRALCV